MADLTGMLQAAAGSAGGEKLYSEDVFSCFLYTGTGSAQTITNGIDLDGEGGLVWIKSRSAATNHFLFDTERGALNELNSNTADAEASLANSLTAFNSDGFSISSATGIGVSAATYASWSFRKAPKFFDCVTFAGNGVSGRVIPHNLGSVPGCIIIRRINDSADWYVWHRSLTSGNELKLNSTGAEGNFVNNIFTNVTDSGFDVDDSTLNGSTYNYVAYLFAHDAGGFGDDGEQNVISCGSFTSNGSGKATVNLGYEPQWVLIKNSTGSAANWVINDSMRGMSVETDQNLSPNTSGAEQEVFNQVMPNATGFSVGGGIIGVSTTYIYIAIRRGPMKTPTAGTEVFTPQTRSGTGSAATVTGAGFPPDTALLAALSGTFSNTVANFNRLIGPFKHLDTSSNAAENTDSNSVSSFDMDGISFAGGGAGNSTFIGNPEPYVNYYFLRAPGFFDVVCYTGTGSARTVAHNLGVVPELMIVKNRSQADAWAVYAGDNTDYLVLNTTAATADLNTYWNDTSPTSTVFTVGTVHNTNASAENYIAYLFASLAGISKVGTYTGNGSSVTVTTGFQPRFILVKRTDSTGNWIVGDSARGLVAGDDPALFLNSTAAETTGQDWVDISATGFTVNETALNANVSTATYIYLCVS